MEKMGGGVKQMNRYNRTGVQQILLQLDGINELAIFFYFLILSKHSSTGHFKNDYLFTRFHIFMRGFFFFEILYIAIFNVVFFYIIQYYKSVCFGAL